MSEVKTKFAEMFHHTFSRKRKSHRSAVTERNVGPYRPRC